MWIALKIGNCKNLLYQFQMFSADNYNYRVWVDDDVTFQCLYFD